MLMIIDYGIGNLGSVKNMIRHLGGKATVTNNPDELRNASSIVLPGVGKFSRAMELLHKKGWVEALDARTIKDGIPTLGICLGMQLMTRQSEESPDNRGLGWIEADTVRFHDEADNTLRIPHMGWNVVTPTSHSRLIKNDEEEKRFYFVHSYHVVCDNQSDVVGTTLYGKKFVSAIQRDNIFGLQPHPEKSHRFGMAVFNQFLNINTKIC